MIFSSEYSLHWLTASIAFLVFFGLLRMGIAVSKMMKDKDGNFEILVNFEGRHTKHQINQKAYARGLRIISYPIIAVSTFSFIAFCITLLA